jgi:hypothetical protein
MNIERLTRLAELLDRVEPNKFDMNRWFSKTDCGYVACAAGHAALDPWFQSEGLYLGFADDEEYLHSIPCYGYKMDDEALAAFFDITNEQVSYVFMPYSYPIIAWAVTPSWVAGRVREIIRTPVGEWSPPFDVDEL